MLVIFAQAGSTGRLQVLVLLQPAVAHDVFIDRWAGHVPSD
jgi:hypothetical protein